MSPPSRRSATLRRGILRVPAVSLGLPSRSSPKASEGWWAHQDSNLERAGYEPAALTIELWARDSMGQIEADCELLILDC
jgi:hypothetical protein